MTREQAIEIVINLQNKKENQNRDIVTFCAFFETVEEILAHAKRNGWEG